MAEEQQDDVGVRFSPYESFKNASHPESQALLEDAAAMERAWVAVEKVHGSNFQFVVMPSLSVLGGRRSALLGEDEGFHSWQGVRDRLADALRALYALVVPPAAAAEEGAVLRVYGELYGGSYPGVRTSTKPVQKGVCYAPEISFAAFDAHVSAGDGGGWLTHDELCEACTAAGVPVLPVLHRGSLPEMLALDPVFSSLVPAQLHGLAPPAGPNAAEGYVLKTNDRGERLLIKHKNPAFLEHVPTNVRAAERRDREEHPAAAAAAEWVVVQRLENVVSKMTPAEVADKGRVLRALVDDALEDWRAHRAAEGELGKKEVKAVTAAMFKAAASVWDEWRRLEEGAEEGAEAGEAKEA
mmetsp:Transcript_15890/g.53906  ORF Transcript_15890/g.53906 Transcript_15890/m.53906 type:complete len:355 (+) Transcript_15890:128-1192(+)